MTTKKTRLAQRISEGHPSNEIIGTESKLLSNKRIVICITGSVAAYRAIDFSRLLMRHGAEVFPVMTDVARSQFLTQQMMKWSTGNRVVTKLTSDLEHIKLADYNKSDLIVVYPCTANTIGKFAHGIDDSPVTTVLSVGFGSGTKILIAPAMHQSMYENKIITKNISVLKTMGINFVDPILTENKAKVASPEEVLNSVFKILVRRKDEDLFDKVLVTAGSTLEKIDPVRVLTNLSSGKMGITIAQMAAKQGMDVTLIYGHGQLSPPPSPNLKIIRVETAAEMYQKMKHEIIENKPQILFHAAAVSDFTIDKPIYKKIDSASDQVRLKLVPTKKIINEVKKWRKKIVLVAFKAEYGVSQNTLLTTAFSKLQESNADFIVANDLAKRNCGFGSDLSEVYILDKHNHVIHMSVQLKKKVAEELVKIVTRTNMKNVEE
ncbi:MAG TPA: bifunctional phosphopantothenoylcysteine decarboxylase/phosphopantothenate--cysteine ligase CoaBC [Nitrososphaeraceae archaeon]|jgi:phosphopantothenoylcysteine decarboxylase/phosphopantothenate--cysteine ligase